MQRYSSIQIATISVIVRENTNICKKRIEKLSYLMYGILYYIVFAKALRRLSIQNFIHTSEKCIAAIELVL